MFVNLNEMHRKFALSYIVIKIWISCRKEIISFLHEIHIFVKCLHVHVLHAYKNMKEFLVLVL